ncbi:cysteine-rich PDZ-binding protein [Sporobolomyces salmoneus]|uniref:cysteine-rich PDZ-binding protein n=1 Tax=Sporobolomyces salmoneus TaxID=183962 RepID=UPI00316BCD51
MVCAKCEKKLSKSSSSSLACSDVWRSASSSSSGSSSTPEAGRNTTRKLGENKLLSSKARYSPYAPPTKTAGGALSKPGVAAAVGLKGKEKATIGKCAFCKSTVARPEAQYCQSCAYKKGICSICAKPILDTSQYKMSSK